MIRTPSALLRAPPLKTSSSSQQNRLQEPHGTRRETNLNTISLFPVACGECAVCGFGRSLWFFRGTYKDRPRNRDLQSIPEPSLSHSVPSRLSLPIPTTFHSFSFLSCVIEMHSADPTLPSIAFVLSQAQQPTSTSRDGKRRGKFGLRRSKSSPSIAPHSPQYPPQLDNEFLKVNHISPFPCLVQHLPSPLPQNTNASFAYPSTTNPHHFCDSRKKTVDYRFINPPRAPSRSSFALVSKNYCPGSPPQVLKYCTC
jgi:hypothetical protein